MERKGENIYTLFTYGTFLLSLLFVCDILDFFIPLLDKYNYLRLVPKVATVLSYISQLEIKGLHETVFS